MPNLYIISGCNGSGKTTASYTVLPEMLDCHEFVNADTIAADLSPFDPGSVAFEAGRIMLHRIKKLLEEQVDFAFETTLSARSYVALIKDAKVVGYEITLLYFWLNSTQMAIERVAKRVSMGGHNIPSNIIERRYYRGIKNLLDLYIPLSDNWIVIDNMDLTPEIVAKGAGDQKDILISDIWKRILKSSHHG